MQRWHFENAKLTSLAFAEHNPYYPCSLYSIVFSSNLGGPKFYVDAKHVPMKLANDSCFATIISRKDVIDSLLAST